MLNISGWKLPRQQLWDIYRQELTHLKNANQSALRWLLSLNTEKTRYIHECGRYFVCPWTFKAADYISHDTTQGKVYRGSTAVVKTLCIIAHIETATKMKLKRTGNKSIVPWTTMHTGRIYCQSTDKGVNYSVNNNHAWHFLQTLRPIVYAFQNLDRNFENLVAPPTDGYANCLERYKVHVVP